MNIIEITNIKELPPVWCYSYSMHAKDEVEFFTWRHQKIYGGKIDTVYIYRHPVKDFWSCYIPKGNKDEI